MKKFILVLISGFVLFSAIARAEVIDRLDRHFSMDIELSTSGRGVGNHKIVAIGDHGGYEISCEGNAFWAIPQVATLTVFTSIQKDMSNLDFRDGKILSQMDLGSVQACEEFRALFLRAKAGQEIALDVIAADKFRLLMDGDTSRR